ncbi:GntR family transcriptional regulator [Paraburkholderia sp. CNPSo 3157]|uniref:GntR family transcriptional regulator n=2 Tax=Paraburkholderia franconis TaxID=2654983 RepID=A0A7X1NHW9_9BURK|nr:GntR family transcriptional regulator [Paraburkholderia franconis]
MATGTEHSRVFEALRRPSRDGVPKYVRLTDALVEAITSGYWKAGDKLPTEEELAEMTPFSLGTVQRALRNLAEQGIVIRQHGLGSFVAETDLRLEDPWHCRFLDDDGQTILPVYSKVVKRERVKMRGSWSEYFPNRTESLFRIDRVINVNNEFNVFTHFFADSRMLPALWDTPISKLNGVNFKAMIARELNVPITRIGHMVRAEPFDEAVAAILNVKVHSVGIFMQAAAHMGEKACVYYQEFFIPMTRRTLSIPEQMLGGSATLRPQR